MKFRVGDRVRISLPEGAQWNKKTLTKPLSAEDVNGQEGVITQHLSHTGQSEYKVLLKELGEFRFWERDLEHAPEEPKQNEPESSDSEKEDYGA